MDMKLPFSTTGMMLHIDDSMDYEVLSSSIEVYAKERSDRRTKSFSRQWRIQLVLQSFQSLQKEKKM